MATLPKPMPKSKPLSKAGAATRATSPEPRPRIPAERSIPASKAKTHLLELLDTVDHKREAVIITKRGRPVARLVPIEETQPQSIFGCMKGTFKIIGDIVGPEPDIWEAMS
jgi:prevent-host-death family protein